MTKQIGRNPKKVGSRSNRDRDRENRRVAEENRRNKKKTIKTKNLRGPGGPRRSKFNGEEYFTFSLDGLIPAYGDPSQVRIFYIKIFLFLFIFANVRTQLL